MRRETVDGAEVVHLDTRGTYDGLSGAVRGAWYLATLVERRWRRAIEHLVEWKGVDAVHVHDLPLVRRPSAPTC